ncbi:DUF998 domain-containing protein [Streptomyces ovatisporus]|uniref:DUF998 domain-containing protein n=1 Tax=Streptomyces ovatisporus TaxID=1128682 RepID=A0ABV9A045_9ACTN
MARSVLTSEPSAPTASTTRLLIAGSIAGPLFVAVVIIQQSLRAGFDPRIHALSMLSLGGGGWVQTLNFLVSGILAICGAIGLRSALRAGVGRLWGPLLIGLYGVGLIWGGLFPTDPALGFPDGASTPTSQSWHGTLHALSPTITGIALIAACIVFARRYGGQGLRGLTSLAIITPLIYLGLGFSAFPLGDLRLLLAGGTVIWLWPFVIMFHEMRSAPPKPR